MPQQTVPLYTVSSGERAERARKSLADALGNSSLGAPDETGAFEVRIDAASPEEAQSRLRDALAASGTGDDFALRAAIAGREMPTADEDEDEDEDEVPPPPSPDERAGHVADAASRVEQVARQLAREEAKPTQLEEAAEKLAHEAPERVAAATRRLAEQGSEAHSDPDAAAAEVAAALRRRDWRRIGPPAAGIVGLLLLLRRITRSR